METTGNGGWYSTVEQRDFDDKQANFKYGNPDKWMFPGINNHGAIKATSKLLGLFSDRRYKYTYNETGFPIKAEIFDNFSGGALIETHEYFYKPAK